MQDPLKTNPNGFEEKSSDLCPTGSAIESVAGDCLVHSERDNKIETVLKRLRVKDRKDFKLYYEKNHIELGSLAAVRKFLLARLKVGIKNMLLSPTPNDEISQEVAQRVVELLWLDLAIEEINTND